MNTSEISVPERRRVRRTRVLKGAKIIFGQRAPTADCLVRNLTNLGACLRVSDTVGIPARFELTFDDGRSCRACRVIWRHTDSVGVIFE
jgi:hypothetical protein